MGLSVWTEKGTTRATHVMQNESPTARSPSCAQDYFRLLQAFLLYMPVVMMEPSYTPVVAEFQYEIYMYPMYLVLFLTSTLKVIVTVSEIVRKHGVAINADL